MTFFCLQVWLWFILVSSRASTVHKAMHKHTWAGESKSPWLLWGTDMCCWKASWQLDGTIYQQLPGLSGCCRWLGSLGVSSKDGPREPHGPSPALQQHVPCAGPHKLLAFWKPVCRGQTQLEMDFLGLVLSQNWGSWVGKYSAETQPPGTWGGAGRWDGL